MNQPAWYTNAATILFNTFNAARNASKAPSAKNRYWSERLGYAFEQWARLIEKRRNEIAMVYDTAIR